MYPSINIDVMINSNDEQLLRTGKIFRDPNKRSVRSALQAGSDINRLLPDLQDQFHWALDELEIQMVSADWASCDVDDQRRT